jgi:hypothetical protein
MNVERTQRGFPLITHDAYPPKPGDAPRLVQASSAVGPYDDAFDRPGSSFLWVGDRHHLNRDEVAELVRHLQSWLDTGSFAPGPPAAAAAGKAGGA